MADVQLLQSISDTTVGLYTTINLLKGIVGLHIRLSTGMRYCPASTDVAQLLCYRAGMLVSCWISTAHFLLAGTYFTGLIGVPL